MITLWIAAAVMTALAVAPLVWRLLRDPGTAAGVDRSALLLGQLKAQLAEIEREVERDLIEPAEAEALRLEIKRRLLAAVDEKAAAGETAPAAGKRPLPLAIGVGSGVAAASLALYLALGSPAVPDQPLAARRGADAIAAAPAVNDAEMRQFRDAVSALEKRLVENPEDVRGWVLLGGAYRSEQRYAEAARAFGEAYRRTGDDPALAADYAEARIAAGGGRIDEESEGLLERALAFDPRDVRARFFLALGQAQAGDVAAALQGWVDLAALVPPQAPFLPVVHEHIARAAAVLGVDAASVAPSPQARALAAMTPQAQAAQQAATVREMVDRLAERLAREPDDRDGWLKLARAYEVMGEAAKAAQARAQAARLATPQ